MKRFAFLLPFSLIAGFAPISDPAEITYEWLVEQGKESGYSDHIPHFRKLFEMAKVRNFLEFGVGYSTHYFLERCEEVVSVEFVVEGAGPAFMQEMMRLYREKSHWIPYVFFSGYPDPTNWAPYQYVGSDAVSKAAFVQCATHKSFAWVDGSYLEELNDFITSLCEGYRIDLAFVDPGIYLRGDLVQLLFDKVPMIAAHDSNHRFFKDSHDAYGYSRIETPAHYEEIHIGRGQGTTFWILKNESTANLIEEMKKYAL